ncbi:MAG: NAD(+)/NADH kinase [Candidatus Thorarchaeota archaeon]
MLIEPSPKILSEKNRVGVVCRPERIEIERFANRLVANLLKRGLQVQVDRGSCRVEDARVDHVSIEDMDVDFIITVGGDGTILYTLQRLRDRRTPLYCVNRGTVGFLTESSTTTAISALDRILASDCVVEHCVNLASGSGEMSFPDALNEVYITSKIPGRLLTFRIRINGNRVGYGRADGCMLSTPCGSTAYALAAGGSILTPGVNGFILVPVCPPRFELKPMVIPDSSTVELDLVKPGASGIVIVDGQSVHEVTPGSTVWLRKSDSFTRFIRLHDNYFERLNTRVVPRTL